MEEEGIKIRQSIDGGLIRNAEEARLNLLTPVFYMAVIADMTLPAAGGAVLERHQGRLIFLDSVVALKATHQHSQGSVILLQSMLVLENINPPCTPHLPLFLSLSSSVCFLFFLLCQRHLSITQTSFFNLFILTFPPFLCPNLTSSAALPYVHISTSGSRPA